MIVCFSKKMPFENLYDFSGRRAKILCVARVTRLVFLICNLVPTDFLWRAASGGCRRPFVSVTSGSVFRHQMELANSELTNLGYIDYWLSAIHSQTAQNSERGGGGGGDGGGAERGGAENTVLSPPIFIVGTHLFNVHRDPLIRQQMVTASCCLFLTRFSYSVRRWTPARRAHRCSNFAEIVAPPLSLRW